MTQSEDAPPPDEGIRPGRRRAILLGVAASVVAVLAVFLAPVLGNFGGLWPIVPVIALAVISYQRRGSGFGVGVAWGCGVILVIAGGACISFLMTYQ